MNIDKTNIGAVHNAAKQLRTAIALPTDFRDVVVYVAIDAAPGRPAPNAELAIAVDAVARSLAIDRQPVLSVDAGGERMTWGAFIDAFDQGSLPPGQGLLATADAVSDFSIVLPDHRDEQYQRPGWATHVVWLAQP